MTTQKGPADQTGTPPDLIAAWVIGIYLVLEVLLLGYVAAMFWLSSDINQLLNFSLHSSGFDLLRSVVTPDKFASLRQLALAACSAGTGGSAFMIREFYINFAYGSQNSNGHLTYLRNREIPRYILLPFSSIVLGPISIFLLQAGAIVFAGFSVDKAIPDYTIITVSFLFGFSYHDSLKALRNLSLKMLGGGSDEGKKS